MKHSSYPLPKPLSSGEGPFLYGGYRPRTPCALKALSDFCPAKVPGTGGRLMTAF